MKPLDIDITNKEVLERLNILKDMFYDYKMNLGLELDPKGRVQQYSSDMAKSNPLHFLSSDYLKEMKQKENHLGFPEEYMSFPTSQLEKYNAEWKPFLTEVKDGLTHYFGSSKSSLATYYPPKGFVGWHTNWNNPGYQILLTWSETGDSYFLYEEDDEIKKIQERPGWQAHVVKFGNKESDEVFWHAAYTNCDRFAWAPTWESKGGPDEMLYDMVKDVIDDLQQD